MKEPKLYYQPTIHYSRYELDSNIYERCETREEADEICVYTQVRKVRDDCLVDGCDEECFPNTDEGHLAAVKYADSLSKRPDYRDYEWD